MRRNLNLIGQCALSIISTTIIIIPFMLFIQLSNGSNWSTILPFILFYIFRMTGIFFIRGIKTTLNSYSLLKISLISGLLGCIFSVLGSTYFPMYILGGFFLGLSGAWLPPSNTSLNIYLKKQNEKQKSSNIISLIMIAILGITMFSPINFRYSLCFSFYGLLYIISLYMVYQYSGYKIASHDLEESKYSYLVLFFSFLFLLFLLRSSRLMLNSEEFDYFIYGYIFLIILGVIRLFIFKSHEEKRLPRSLSFLTIINGSLGNYLFLFCSLYASGYYGREAVAFKVYLPYVLGMFLSTSTKKFIFKNMKNYSLLGVIVGLVTILATPFFSLGIFLISLFKSILNSWLTIQYSETESLPMDKRIWVKYTIQNIGSISHQFILMILASVILTSDKKTVKEFFIYSSRAVSTHNSMVIMQSWNHIATALILLLVAMYYLIILKIQYSTKDIL
ncbi:MULTISPECIES: hypothetical protein [Enterococcus]|uniref:hypothetical protein n=1 Tax=Enterococcus sp. AZ103 TaxID=2774628 RepID=UPI003F29A68E